MLIFTAARSHWRTALFAAALPALFSGCSALEHSSAAERAPSAAQAGRSAPAQESARAKPAAQRAAAAQVNALERQAHARSEERIAAARSLEALSAPEKAEPVYLGGHPFVPSTTVRQADGAVVFGWKDQLEAAWLVIGTPDDPTQPVTLLRSDKRPAHRVWLMTVRPTTDAGAALKSQQKAFDANCSTRRIRLAFQAEYADYWAFGAPKLNSIAGARWEKPEAGTPVDDAWTLACTQR